MSSLLVRLKKDLENFDPDRANFIRGYWDKTGIKISLIFSLMEVNRHLISNSNPELTKKFKIVLNHFVTYISKKIESGTSDEEDLLFELKEIASTELVEAVPGLIKDVEQLEKDHDTRKKINWLLTEKKFTDLLNFLECK